MKTLIVLCAGSRMINGKPLYLNRHPEGKLLAEKTIEGIHPEEYDRIIYTILRGAQEEFNAEKILLDSIGKKYPVEVVALEKQTNGPAHTVYETIQKANIEGEFAVRDSLNWITINGKADGNFIAGLDLTLYDGEVFKVRTKSFIITNEQSQVLDVVEKKFRSDVISVGLYGFKSVNDYNLAYERLNDINYPIKRVYLSNIISYLIGYRNRVFHCVDVNEHEDWGSEETWHFLQNKYEMCFVNLDEIVATDSDSFEKDILDIFSLKKNKKQSYVFYTVRKNIEEEALKSKLNETGINCLAIISSCPLTDTKVFINNEDELNKVLIGV